MTSRIAIADLLKAKRERRPIAAVACYDYTTARLVSQARVEMVLAGDSAAQMISTVGRLRAEATTAEVAVQLISLAARLVDAGASVLLIEGAGAEVAQVITERSPAPVIYCGSGPGCDGQILVAPDILGLTETEAPRFAKAYAELSGASIEAFRRYADEVKTGRYPDADHSYHMKSGQMDRLTRLLHP